MRVVLLPPLAQALGRRSDGRRLARRVARARPLPPLPPGRLAQLEAFFGIQAPELAWLAAVADGLEEGTAWVRVEPVCVHVDIASLWLLAHGEGIGLSPQEELALFESLERWCGQRGILARRTAFCRWFLATPADWPSPGSDPPERWLGRTLDWSWRAPRAPWSRLLAELEMLFAGHPLNLSRRQRGLSPVTGVWAWGGRRGEVGPQGSAARGGIVISGDPLVQASARRLGMEAFPELLDRPLRRVTLLDCASATEGDSLAPPVPAEWWFGCGRRFAVGRLDVFCFWRRSGLAAHGEANPVDARLRAATAWRAGLLAGAERP